MWGKIRQDFRKFLPKQSMQNILYVIILTLTLLVAVFVGFFVSKSQQEKQAQIIVQDNQELAEQINVSMSQYLHSMMRLSDTLYYNIIKGNDRGQMEQMFQAMYDGYKDYVESIALFQEDGTLLQVMPALSSAASSDVMQEEWFSSALERSENMAFLTEGTAVVLCRIRYQIMPAMLSPTVTDIARRAAGTPNGPGNSGPSM